MRARFAVPAGCSRERTRERTTRGPISREPIRDRREVDMSLYLGMDRATLDAAYNNSAAVTESARIMADWQERSDAFAAAWPQHLDVRYGKPERDRLDLFVAAPGAPLLVFIHGGYWQMRAKENFRFLAQGPLAHGINVAFVGYTLAPEARLDRIVAEVRASIAWLATHAKDHGADAERLYVSGWSAGGHLTAMMLSAPGVRGGLAISGIFDLEPIRLSYLNDKLSLDEAEARRNSPLLHLGDGACPLLIAYGADELPELQRQSEEFATARSRAGLPGRVVRVPGRHHFSILEELARPTGALTALVNELVWS
jgi:acetyl esterase/lipase